MRPISWPTAEPEQKSDEDRTPWQKAELEKCTIHTPNSNLRLNFAPFDMAARPSTSTMLFRLQGRSIWLQGHPPVPCYFGCKTARYGCKAITLYCVISAARPLDMAARPPFFTMLFRLQDRSIWLQGHVPLLYDFRLQGRSIWLQGHPPLLCYFGCKAARYGCKATHLYHVISAARPLDMAARPSPSMVFRLQGRSTWLQGHP